MDVFRWKRDLLIIITGLILGAGIGIFILSMPEGFWPWSKVGDPAGLIPGAVTSLGSTAPDFQLNTISGTSVRLSDFRGRAVLINFWATWCVPCREEMPLIQSRYEMYPDSLTVLAVNFDEPAAGVTAYTQELGLTFDILLDPGGEIQKLYRVRGYPTTYIIDAQGIIQDFQVGSLSEKQLDGYLKEVGVGK